jgi:hypothetical protein
MPDEPIGWLLLAVFLVTLALFLVLSLDSCSLFSPVAEQDAPVRCVDRPRLPGEYPRGSNIALDINTGPPLLSTPHRVQDYCPTPPACEVEYQRATIAKGTKRFDEAYDALVDCQRIEIAKRNMGIENPDPMIMPETSTANAFSSLDNVPVTLGSMIPSGAPAAAVLGAGL